MQVLLPNNSSLSNLPAGPSLC